MLRLIILIYILLIDCFRMNFDMLFQVGVPGKYQIALFACIFLLLMTIHMFHEFMTISKIQLSLFSFVFRSTMCMSLSYMLILVRSAFEIQVAFFTCISILSNIMFYQHFLLRKCNASRLFGSFCTFMKLCHMKDQQFLSWE